MPETLSNRALCTLDDVREFLSLEETDTAQDNLLIRQINSASEDIYRITEREFRAINSDGTDPPDAQTRALEVGQSVYDLDEWLACFVAIGDAKTVTAVVVKDLSGTTVQTMDIAKVDALPRIRQPWEPITHLRLRDYTLAVEQVVEVTGVWGFPSVPEDIRGACIHIAAMNYSRDIAKFSATFSLTEDRVELPHQVPPQVMETLMRYQRPRIG